MCPPSLLYVSPLPALPARSHVRPRSSYFRHRITNASVKASTQRWKLSRTQHEATATLNVSKPSSGFALGDSTFTPSPTENPEGPKAGLGACLPSGSVSCPCDQIAVPVSPSTLSCFYLQSCVLWNKWRSVLWQTKEVKVHIYKK